LAVRADQLIEKLLQTVDRQVGLDNVLVVLTGDHGAAPRRKSTPCANAGRTHSGDHAEASGPGRAGEEIRSRRLGRGTWDVSVYLNQSLIALRQLDLAEVDRVAAQALRAMPHIARVYTREEIARGEMLQDDIGRLITMVLTCRADRISRSSQTRTGL